MKTRIPPETKMFTGFTEQLTDIETAISHCCIINIYGEHGVGKSELSFKTSNDLLKKSRLKPLYFKLKTETSGLEFYKDLALSLPKAQQRQLKTLDLEDQLEEIIYYWESKGFLILIENTQFLEATILENLVEKCDRYFEKSRLILNSVNAPELKNQSLHQMKAIELLGFTDFECSHYMEKLKSKKTVPDHIRNPELIGIIAANDDLAHVKNNFESWMDKVLEQDKKNIVIQFFHWGKLPESHFSKLPIEFKEQCDNLIKRKILVFQDNLYFLAPSFSQFLPDELKANNNETVYELLLSALSEKESLFYLLKMDRTVDEELIKNYCYELISESKISEFNNLNEILVSKNNLFPELIIKDIEFSVELENFDRANIYLSIFENEFPENIKSLSFVNTICQLYYNSKEIDKFKDYVKIFENLINSKKPEYEVDYLHWKALLLRDNHDYLKACKTRLKALSLITNLVKYKTHYNHLYHLGIDYFWISDFDQSYIYSKKAKDLAQECMQFSDIQKANYNLCIALDELGRQDEATLLLKDLNDLLKKRPNPSLKISVLFYEANRLFNNNELAQAITVLEESRPVAQRYGSQNQQIAHELYLSEIYLAAGFSNKCNKSMERADMILKGRGKSPFRWRMSRLKAQYYFHLFKYDELLDLTTLLKSEIHESQDQRENSLIGDMIYISDPTSDVNEVGELTQIMKSFVQMSSAQNQIKNLNPNTLDKAQLSVFRALRSLLLSEQVKVPELLCEVDKSSPWIYWTHQSLLCFEASQNANYKLSTNKYFEYLKVQGHIEDPGFRLCKVIFSLSSLINNYKLNQWDKVSYELVYCRQQLLGGGQHFQNLLRPFFNRAFKKLNLAGQEDLFSNFVLGQADVYIFPSVMVVANQALNLVPLEKKKLLFDLLIQLKTAGSKILEKEDLVKLIWNQEYDPEQHDQTLYVNISRLKKILETELGLSDLIINQDAGYGLSPRLRTILLE